MLRVHKGLIVDRNGKQTTLKGVNFGGWLMMEAYILQAPNVAVQKFKKNFAKVLGAAALRDFEKKFQTNFITEKDFANVAALGFNCIRLPFQYNLIEKSPYRYDQEGVKVLDDVFKWAGRYNLQIVLDLHGAAGSQNCDWHSDSLGKAELWSSKAFQKRTYALWEFLADRFKDEPQLAGYDLLNEAVMSDTKLLNAFYREAIRSIRRSDKNHIVFVEGNTWAQDLDCLDKIDDDNHVLSIHSYEPFQFVFNFLPLASYPIRQGDRLWNKDTVRNHLEKYHVTAQKRGVPIFLGEFGVNYRAGIFNEQQWVKDMMAAVKEFGFHWTYWTYKSIKNHICPDGLYSYYENPPWVNRAGPLSGWDTYHLHWKEHKDGIVQSWRTENFKENSIVVDILKEYV